MSTTNTDQFTLAVQLSQLTDLGFTDDKQNTRLLRENGYDLSRVTQLLIDKQIALTNNNNNNGSVVNNAGIRKSISVPPPAPLPNSATGTTDSSEPPAIATSNGMNSEDEDRDECKICFTSYEDRSQSLEGFWKPMDHCSHAICIKCYQKLESSAHLGRVKCPFCRAVGPKEDGDDDDEGENEPFDQSDDDEPDELCNCSSCRRFRGDYSSEEEEEDEEVADEAEAVVFGTPEFSDDDDIVMPDFEDLDDDDDFDATQPGIPAEEIIDDSDEEL